LALLWIRKYSEREQTMEYILYAKKPNQPDYLEEIITETKSLSHLEKAKKWATKNGFVSLRVGTFENTEEEFNDLVKFFRGQ